MIDWYLAVFVSFRFLFQQYNGLRYQKGNCGVSIVRSGEAMEKALQDCCRSMRIGKILVDSDTETHEARYKSTITRGFVWTGFLGNSSHLELAVFEYFGILA